MDLKKETDGGLAVLAKNGNVSAQEELYFRYKPIVKNIARSYFIMGGDMDDVMQEGMFGLFGAVKNYKEGYEFKAFACLCIKRSIISAVKKSGSQRFAPLNDATEYDESEEETRGFDPDDPLEGKNFRERCKDILSAFEYGVLEFYLDGFSYAEIAEKTGKELKSIDNAIQRIRKKLAKEFK